MNKLKKTLTPEKRERFSILRKIIKDGLGTCFKVGGALLSIRDEKLYAEDFDTFEEFVQEEYGMERAHAYRLIDSVEVKNSISMSPIGDKITNESQTRELSKVPKGQRVAVIKEADSKGPITAKSINEIANSVVQKNGKNEQEKEVVRDKTGVPIPPKPLEYWNRRQEVQDFLTALTRLKSQIENSESDLLWAGVRSHLISQLEGAYGYAKDAMPYSVCTVCQGYPEVTKCGFCGTLGILPKWRYESQGDDRIRALREKQYAKFVK